ncbi:MAG: flagellar basal body-associated FliL family protein [Oligoflexia bacterium]|nr:flagellar basal body-associated FliL family protein [Oligoflexia bacterium]MBF0365269.1 flagellar basal body-associated FliL family protein [Oligoflexia bacterium]
MILGALSLLVGLGTVGVFVYTGMIYKAPVMKNVDELESMKQKLREESFKVKLYKVDRISLNLKSQEGRLRYADIEMNFLLFEDSLAYKLDDKKPMLYDKIIEIASTITAEELNSVTGKIILEEKIKNATRVLLGKPVIKSIYFSTFIVK